MTTQTSTLTVRVRCFAQLKDRLGKSEVALTLPAGATGRELMSALRERYPAAAPLLGVCRLAVNYELAPVEAPLHQDDEVAVIPPVSGG